MFHLESQLLPLGLTDKEAKAYLALLRYGTQTTSFIAKKALLNRGTSYVALHSLLQKGLVVKSSKRGVQHFTALEPRALVDYMSGRERELRNQRKHLEGVIGELTALVNPRTTRPKMRFLEGAEGGRRALEETLQAKDKTLRAFLSLIDVADFVGSEFFFAYTKQRIKKGYTLHAIRTLQRDNLAVARDRFAKQYFTSRKERREVRYASEALSFPTTMYIFDDRLLMLSTKEEGFALIIESQELSEMQRKLFLLIWDSLGYPGNLLGNSSQRRTSQKKKPLRKKC